MNRKIKLKKPLLFERDKGNKEKNVHKHNVQNSESEEVFVNNPILLIDVTHSQGKDRYVTYGVTDKKRSLVIAFTLRGTKAERIRVISSRNQDKKEQELYHKLKSEVKKNNMNQIKSNIPKFRNEDEEREFWATHSTADYVDNFEVTKFDFSELKPSTKTISLRLPQSIIDQLKKLADKRGVPYQSLLKIFLSEKIQEESMQTA